MLLSGCTPCLAVPELALCPRWDSCPAAGDAAGHLCTAALAAPELVAAAAAELQSSAQAGVALPDEQQLPASRASMMTLLLPSGAFALCVLVQLAHMVGVLMSAPGQPAQAHVQLREATCAQSVSERCPCAGQ